VETPEAGGPFGARCVAEHPMVAVSPTILNALYDATGHDFFHIPVTPKDIRQSLKAKGARHVKISIASRISNEP
jgi:CO/xanthine dehydrogenase Mo-binding subunit